MAEARRVKAAVKFNGRDVSQHVTDFTYTDNSDKTDDVSVTLEDREERWSNEWFPETGDMLNCTLEVFDWNAPGDNRKMKYGNFEIDNVDFGDVVTMNAVAVPITSNARSVFVKIKMQQIAPKNAAP